jgi:ornithine carbamoyltransferase
LKRDILSVLDMKDDFEVILTDAVKMKSEPPKKGQKQFPLKGKVLGMVFEKPSLRTRISFEVGMHRLGGKGLYIGPDEVSIGKRESVSDVAHVLSRYVDAIMYRAFSNKIMRELAENASVPVINGLDDLEHPCQCAADLMTVLEKKGKLAGLKMAYVGDGNNVCNSLMLGCALAGMTTGRTRTSSPRRRRSRRPRTARSKCSPTRSRRSRARTSSTPTRGCPWARRRRRRNERGSSCPIR